MSEHWHSNQTQIYWTCAALLQGRIINHMDEIGEVRGWRLGAIVHTLRHQYDWPIVTEFRGPERIAHYRLRADYRPAALRFPRSARRLQAALANDTTTRAHSARDAQGPRADG